MVELYCLWNIKNTNTSVDFLQSTVKVLGNKVEDTDKMGVTSKGKNIFFVKKRNFFQTKEWIDFFQK